MAVWVVWRGGGCWYDPAESVQVSNRDWYKPGYSHRSLGLRLVIR